MRTTLLGLLVLLTWSGLPAAGQELRQDVLEKVKAATAFVVVETAHGEGSGSGFLFLKRGTAGYVLTCEHVLGDEETAKIVFGSGTGKEKAYEGKVIATDPDRDIACLILKDVKGLPAPLEIGPKTAVKETEAVFVAGFPFGRFLAAGEKNPEITVTRATVSSLRRDEDERLKTIQLSGDVNPGNSGGPVVDATGKVVGVAWAKVQGTATAFAVPPEQVQGFLKGRVKTSLFKKISSTATGARFEATVGLVDPLGMLKAVTMAYCPEGAVDDPKPGEDGTWGKISPNMKSVTLKAEEDVASAAFEVMRGSSEPDRVTLLVQISFTTSDGATHWTEPVPLDVEFAKEEKQEAEGEPAPKSEEPKASEVPVADEVPVVATLRLKAVIADLFLSPEGSWLYALDLSEGKVYRIAPDTMKISFQVDAVENATSMAMSPDGKTLYVGSRDKGDYYGKGSGFIQVISTSSFKTSSTFAVDLGICDLAANNNGVLVSTAVGQGEGAAVIDVSKKSVSKIRSIHGGSFIRMHPDQNRVYTGDVGLSPADHHCVFLRKDKRDQYEEYDSPYHGDYPLGGDFQITPDGRYLIGCRGTVLRLSKTKEADLRYAAKIDPCVSIGLARTSATFVTSNSEGFLKFYSLEDFELKKSVKVDRALSKLALDGSKRRLYAFSCPPSTDRFDDARVMKAGDIVSLSLGGK